MIEFWKNKCCSDETLSVSFSSLFVLATSKDAWVANFWSHSIDKGIWAPRFSRHLNDWEIEVSAFSQDGLVKG